MKFWSWQKENLPSVAHSIRTAVAATGSVLLARLVQMPEAYWAAIATLVVMQSDSRWHSKASIERITDFESLKVLRRDGYGRINRSRRGKLFRSESDRIHACGFFYWPGLVSFRLEKTAYRYASVTLAIIVLIPRTNPAWIVALHRFIEVSVGIIVALIVVALCSERSAIRAKTIEE